MKLPFYARSYFTIFLVFSFLAPLVGAGALRAIRSNKNDIKAWLPDGYPETAQLRWFQTHFGGEEFVIVSWDGCTLDDSRLDLLVGKLTSLDRTQRDRPRFFRSAVSGRSAVEMLTSPPIDLPRHEAVDRLLGSLVGPDRQQTCAILTVTDDGKDDRRGMMDFLHRVAEEECGLPPEALHLGGPPVDNVAVDVEGERTLFRLAGLSGVIGLVLSWWCLRRVDFVTFVLFSGVFSAGMSIAAVWYLGSTMDAVLFSMPSLVYVLALSGSVHIVNYFQDSVEETGIHNAAGSAIRHALLPCTLAACTTAIGLGSLLISELIPVQKFGIFSAIGVVLSLAVLLLLLPGALHYYSIRQRRDGQHRKGAHAEAQPSRIQAFWDALGDRVIRHNIVIVPTMIALMVLVGYGLTRVQTSVNLLNLFNEDAKIIRDYAWLEENLGASIPLEVVLRIPDDSELNFYYRMRLVDVIERTIETVPHVGSALSAASFAPDFRSSRLPRNASPFASLTGRRKTTATVWNTILLKHRGEILREDYLAEGQNEEGQDEELWRISVRVGADENLDYVNFVDGIRERVDPIFEREQFEGIEVVYTGIMPVVYKAQQELFDGLIDSFLLAFGLIAIVMVLLLRGLFVGLMSMIPNIFPAVMIFGIMGWGNVLVDIGSMMTASVAMGVAVDDTIHYLTWFSRGLDAGLSRVEAVRYSYRHCARAMFQTTVIGGFGLSVFAFSTFTPTQRFGVMMLSLLVAALVGDLVLLPALLASPMGRLFDRRKKKRKPADEPAQAGGATQAGATDRGGPKAARQAPRGVNA